jgi:hypothetical protein
MDRMPIWQVAIRRLEIPILRFLVLYVGGAGFIGLVTASKDNKGNGGD